MELARSSGATIGGMKRRIDSEAEHGTDVFLQGEVNPGISPDIDGEGRRGEEVVMVVVAEKKRNKRSVQGSRLHLTGDRLFACLFDTNQWAVNGSKAKQFRWLDAGLDNS